MKDLSQPVHIRHERPLGDGFSAILQTKHESLLCCLQDTKVTNKSYCSQRTANEFSKHLHGGNVERTLRDLPLLSPHTINAFLKYKTAPKNYKTLKNFLLLRPKASFGFLESFFDFSLFVSAVGGLPCLSHC